MNHIKKIYLAGGCFWGMEGYFKQLLGVKITSVGYANGKTENTNYKILKETDHSETLEVIYDKNKIRLEEILLHFFRIIDPISINKQGNDVGRQYRTGIYYLDDDDIEVINKVYSYIENKICCKIVVEKEKLKNYIKAEEYHQNYLSKNPNGYCHINLKIVEEPLFDKKYDKPEIEVLRRELPPLSFEVTQNSATERAFTSELENFYEKGIYVNIVTGEPLFLSYDKFDSGCGWPSFTRPIINQNIVYRKDESHNMVRTEVLSNRDYAHLGHVFTDGPFDKGSLRYCINGAALRFIPYDKMDELGYEDYKIFF